MCPTPSPVARVPGISTFQEGGVDWAEGGRVAPSACWEGAALAYSGLRITEDVYSHLTARLAEESAKALDRAL